MVTGRDGGKAGWNGGYATVAEAYVVTKREPVKYCTYISVGRLTLGNREIDMRASPHACAVMPWGGGGY
jgi:hypothetical protein